MILDSKLNITELLKQAFEADASDITINVKVKNSSKISFRIQGDIKPFKECTYEEVFALWKSIHESQSGEIDASFNPLHYGSGSCVIDDQSKLPVEYRAVKYISQPSVIVGTGFTLVMRLLCKRQTEVMDIKNIGYTKDQQTVLKGFKPDDLNITVIAGHVGKLVREI